MTTRVHVSSPTTPLTLLARLMEENRISAVPVVDDLGTPIGLVSRTDLLSSEADGLVARDVMRTPVISIAAGNDVAIAWRLMRTRSVGCLVAVDERGRIAGIVTRGDLLQLRRQRSEGDQPRQG